MQIIPHLEKSGKRCEISEIVPKYKGIQCSLKIVASTNLCKPLCAIEKFAYYLMSYVTEPVFCINRLENIL